MKIDELANPHIRTLEPYQGGKPIEEVERELGIERAVKLASNEAPIGPSPRVVEAVREAAAGINRYPDGECFYLRRVLADRLGVEPECLFFGAGSDEILEVIAKSFLGPGDEAVFPWPGFAMYPIVAQGMGATPVRVALDDALCTDVEALLDAVTERTRVMFLPNPNNPTGTTIGARAFERLAASVPERVVIACDEAYLEYVRRDDFPDTLAALRERPTLLQLRTFSKVHGLAGLRIGYAVGQPDLIRVLERARHPFNVNSLAQVAAMAALEDVAHVAHVLELTHSGLEQLERGLDALGLRYAESDANFVLVRVGEGAGPLAERLLQRGVITRSMGGFGLDDYLRVTAGLPEENERFLDALRELLE